LNVNNFINHDPFKLRRIAFKTLGCRLNQYETDALASQFKRSGYRIVDFEEKADVYIINTCTVTNQSDQKSRHEINYVTKNIKDSVIVVTGCMVNNQKEKLGNKYGNVSYFVDNAQKSHIFSIIDSHFRGEIIQVEKLERNLFGFEAAEKIFHTRSFIKIQDGCDNFCTYCIVPKVRGRATSRPVDDIISNIRTVLEFGQKEIVITGVNISRYNYDGINFERLVEKILAIEGDFRVRISSIEADGFSDTLYDLFSHPKLMPHMHLCMQSGSDKILLQMRRFYDTKSFINIVDAIKLRKPDFNFTTDIIVGFPGETDKDFQATVDLCKRIEFGHIHTFKYSVRKGTRAERMPDHIPDKLKHNRSEIIRKLSEELKYEYRKKFIGKYQMVLVEKVEKDYCTGYGENYIPVKILGNNFKNNTFIRATIISVADDKNLYLIAKPS